MSNNKICIFTRVHTKDLKDNNINPLLLKEFIKQIFINTILNGYSSFISGANKGFDTICTEIVLELREIYPNVSIEVVIPHETYTIGWREKDKERFFNTVAKCDKETLLQTRYTADCNSRRTLYMIKEADTIIIINKDINIMKIINYANKHQKKIICIDPICFGVLRL